MTSPREAELHRQYGEQMAAMQAEIQRLVRALDTQTGRVAEAHMDGYRAGRRHAEHQAAQHAESDWIVPTWDEPPPTCRTYKVKRLGDGYYWAHRCGLAPDHDGDHELATIKMVDLAGRTAQQAEAEGLPHIKFRGIIASGGCVPGPA